jgi:hypothetical protein
MGIGLSLLGSGLPVLSEAEGRVAKNEVYNVGSVFFPVMIQLGKDLSDYTGCFVTLNDIKGRQVQFAKLDVNANSSTLEFTGLRAGIYLLSIFCDEQIVESYKLIIQK